MDSVGLKLRIGQFIQLYPDTQYNFLVSTDRKYRTISVDAVEHKTEFQKAGEILEAIK